MKRLSDKFGLAMLLAAAAGITHAYVAHAGATGRQPVSINTTTHTFSGSAGTARNSTDTNQFIFCALGASSSGFAALCEAHNSSATVPGVYCTSANLNIISAVMAMAPDSSITVTWDPSTLQCTSVIVRNGSNYDPKEP